MGKSPESELKEEKLGVLGVGTIGGTLIEGLLDNQVVPPERIQGTTARTESAKEAEREYGIKVGTDNRSLAEEVDTLILAVKPQLMSEVLEEIKDTLSEDQLIISLAAAISTQFIEERVPIDGPVIRVMPNIPVTVSEGAVVLCPGSHAEPSHLKKARSLFGPVGEVEVLREEKLMDAVTGLSGSGPAYGYLIVEALTEAGVKVGLPRDVALTLSAKSLLGAARMVLETGQHPAKLKDKVTTPAGVTVDGIMELEKGGIRVALIKAVEEATEKSGELKIDDEK